jgi:hypothetical protein
MPGVASRKKIHFFQFGVDGLSVRSTEWIGYLAFAVAGFAWFLPLPPTVVRAWCSVDFHLSATARRAANKAHHRTAYSVIG